MQSPFIYDEWESSTPTFRSVYHFSILEQSQVRHGYFRGRRPGDAALAGRQRLVNKEFEKTQHLLARSQDVPDRERNEGRRRSRSRRSERRPFSEAQVTTTAPTRESESRLASQSTFGHFDWQEALEKIVIFTVALLICILCTPKRGHEGSAAKMDSFEGIRYELVPDLRRWCMFHPSLYYYKSRY